MLQEEEKKTAETEVGPLQDLYTFVIPRSVLLMRKISDKSCRENQNTHFMCSNFF